LWYIIGERRAGFVGSENFQRIVLESLEGLKEGQARLEGDVASLKEGQTRLEGDVASLKEGQARLEGDVASLKEGQVRLESKVDGLESKVDGLESKIDGLEDRLNELGAKNASRHIQLDTKLNILLEDRKSIFEILGRHETDIATLKRKLG
jgi:chromosome segregation ATPase